MKQYEGILAILLSIYISYECLINGAFLIAGIFIYLIVTILFEISSYYNNKRYIVMTSLITAIMLFLDYTQTSSQLYPKLSVLHFLFIALFILLVSIIGYDFTHKKILFKESNQLKKLNPLIKLVLSIIITLILAYVMFKFI